MRTRVALIVVSIAAAAALIGALSGCGETSQATAASSPPAAASGGAQAVDKLRPHPTVVDPSAGVPVGQSGEAGSGSTGSDDADALPQPRSDADIRRELAASGISAGDKAQLTRNGLAIPPLGAPSIVQTIIEAGNQIARLPYRYGGGHTTWIDTAYDCSASISFAFAAAGLISAPMVSGDLAHWGDPGPGRWITIFANGTHTFMYVAGLRFDTGGLTETGSRWQDTPRGTAGFAVRHPPGL